MTLRSRQLTDFRRLHQASESAHLPAVDQDKPESEPQLLRSGVAEIVQITPEGEYVVTEQAWDAQARNGQGDWVDAVGGYKDKPARDYLNRRGAALQSLVRFWEQYAKPDADGGKLEVLLDVGDHSSFWARIDSSELAGPAGCNRWVYAWSEVTKVAPGLAGWQCPPGGRSGTTTTDPARNTIELLNTGAPDHVEGNGVLPAHLDTEDFTFEMQPCPAGYLVRMHESRFTYQDEEKIEYWFQYENGVDGECDEPTEGE